MKKPFTPLLKGFLIGIAVGAVLAEILSKEEKPEKEAIIPETLENLDRKRIIAVAEERYNDAAILRDAINKIKYNGNTN